MNCRPGDLAVIHSSRHHPELNGVIVEVMYVYKDPFWVCAGHILEEYCSKVGIRPIINDSRLRPIRGQPGEDEMLRIAGKPKEKVCD